jgi:hypothetical protein
MKKAIFLITTLAIILPAGAMAQQGGALVGALGLGFASAQGDFAATDLAAAGSGFGFEAQIRYYPFSGFGLGPMANYVRFGSSLPSAEGRVSYNFAQLGGVARLNMFGIPSGSFFINGGGGIFTPNVHYYVPEESIDRAAEESGNFFFGGIGIASYPDRKVSYELEIRYSVGTADYEFQNMSTSAWDFIYAGVKISFASKGKEAPPRY